MFEFYPTVEDFKEEFLDELLEAGWFRMGEKMFTTDMVINDRDMNFEAHWLCYNIGHVTDAFFKKRNYQKIKAKYTLEYQPINAVDKQELETLFALYRHHARFGESDTLGDILGGYSANFDTHVILLRDEGMLIAAGVFDAGSNSVAAIKNIYHPAYAAEGLGIFLLMDVMKYCKDHSIDWFYPGYIAPGYPNFDYKIYADISEVYILETGWWLPYAEWAALAAAR